MSKLYFKYGAMGSSKTAQALITKFNYEEKNMKVWLLKPSIDDRDGAAIVKSRIGLQEEADVIGSNTDIYTLFSPKRNQYDVIIVDECQFLSGEQVNQLKEITIDFDTPVLCFGLKTDFTTSMFPGSKRLFEIADSLQEIKTICKCGRKATVNARLDSAGNVVTRGSQIMIGGNESYVSMCYECWRKAIRQE